jgi:hypothetical protein
MVDLPTEDHAFYAGIDPGFSGAVGIMNHAGTSVRCWDMPTTGGKGRKREINLDKLRTLFRELRLRPDLVLGLEWPTTRPGEGSERAERFGRQKGILHAYAHLLGVPCYFIAPNLWKGRLGLPGKDEQRAVQRCADYFDRFYPECHDVIRGPKGGIKDGRLDALLIAHFLRTRGREGMQSIVDRFGKNSDEAMAFILSQGGKRKRRKNSGPAL